MNRTYDVAVVGGGLIGATLAAGLRDWPLSVALVDPGVGDGGGGDARSLALSYGSARLYRSLGVWGAVGREAAPIEEVHVSCRGGFGFTRIRAVECGVAALGYVVPARSLQRRLDRDLDAGAGAADLERIRGTVEAVEVGEEAACIEACGPDGRVAFAARLVVGADGAGSAVRRAAGLPLRVHRCDHVAIAGDFVPERPHRGRAYERFTERGPLAVLPLDGDRFGFVWAVPESFAEGEAFAGRRFGAELAAAFGGRIGALRSVRVRVRHRLRVCHAPRISAPRTVLVGNAANALHPVGAQGFNLGLRDVEALARRLGEACAGGVDPTTVVDRYAAERRPDHRWARLLTTSLLRVYGSRLPGMVALGGAGLFTLDRLGPVKRGFASLAMGSGWTRGAAGRAAGDGTLHASGGGFAGAD